MPAVTIRGLAKSAVDAFRTRARQSQRMTTADLKEPIAGLIEKLHLLDGRYLKRAALLLFHPEIGRAHV